MNKAQLEKLEGRTDRLMDATIGLVRMFAMLAPMIHDPRVIKDRGHGARARGFTVLRHALFCASALDVVKLACDDDKRSPSVYNIISTLSDTVVRDLRQRYSVWNLPSSPEDLLSERDINMIEEERRNELTREFDAVWKRVNNAWNDFRARSWCTAFQKFLHVSAMRT